MATPLFMCRAPKELLALPIAFVGLSSFGRYCHPFFFLSAMILIVFSILLAITSTLLSGLFLLEFLGDGQVALLNFL